MGSIVVCNERNYQEFLELRRDRQLVVTRPLNRTLLVLERISE
jgi:hypothetical protein